MSKDVFEIKRYYCTSVFWTVIFEYYDEHGWLLEEIKSDSQLSLSDFKRLAKDIEDIFNKLNRKNT